MMWSLSTAKVFLCLREPVEREKRQPAEIMGRGKNGRFTYESFRWRLISFRWEAERALRIYMPRSLSHDTKKCVTRVFQPLIRRKQLENWPKTYANRLQTLANRTLAKRPWTVFGYCYFYWDTQRESLGRKGCCGTIIIIYPWFKFCFQLFQTHYHKLPYTEKQRKIKHWFVNHFQS